MSLFDKCHALNCEFAIKYSEPKGIPKSRNINIGVNFLFLYPSLIGCCSECIASSITTGCTQCTGSIGIGLFANKGIPMKTCFQYHGNVVDLREKPDQCLDYATTPDPDNAAYDPDFYTLVSTDELSCLTRYANDPIDKEKINAKLVWGNGKLYLEMTKTIKKHDEIYVDYGLGYWKGACYYLSVESLHLLALRYPEFNVEEELALRKLALLDIDEF